MTLRVFSVAGEALHFGARRMETIMRIGWLPVTLLFITQMATFYGARSMLEGKLVTAADIAVTIDQIVKTAGHDPLLSASIRRLFSQLMTSGPDGLPVALLALFLASVVIQLMLVASLVAPLTRLAGLGEAPAKGLVHLPFGANEARFMAVCVAGFLALALFVFGPMAATSFYVLKYVVEAVSATFAIFPDPDSLHTIEIKTGYDFVQENGRVWFLFRGLPLFAAAPFAGVFWALLFAHFRPENRQSGESVLGVLGRAIWTLLFSAGLIGVLWLWVLYTNKNIAPDASQSFFFSFQALAMVTLYWLSVRLAPLAGVAVCESRLLSPSFLKPTRGWNIARFYVVLIILAIVLFGMQIGVNVIGFPAIASTIGSLLTASKGYAALFNGGEAPAWVQPAFIWTWNVVKILYNFFWAFFSYGVLSGLLGRLYRESEGPVARGTAPWTSR